MILKEYLIGRRRFLKISAAGTVGSYMAGGKATALDLHDTQSINSSGAGWPVLTSYSGENLRAIAFPVGGVGTGCLSIGGRGNLQDWEIMNRPSKKFKPQYGFFTLWSRRNGGKPDTRILEGNILPPFTGSHGYPDSTAGLPRFENVSFHAAYPLARVDFSDSECPLLVSMQVFNPLVPNDADRSGIPIALFRFILENPTGDTVKASIAGSLTNFIGDDGVDKYSNVKYKNEFRTEGENSGLYYSATLEKEMSPQNGTIALITDGKSVTFRRHWARSRWSNDLLSFWDDFTEDGMLTDPAESEEQSYTGALAESCEIPSGGKIEILFALGWLFPHRTVDGSGWMGWEKSKDSPDGIIGNYYATKYRDAWDVVTKTIPALDELERETISFVGSLCDSTLPVRVREAALNNISTLRTQNCFRIPDGHFFGFEGTHDKAGCCMGSCTHVWNYEQTTAFLFPELARTMRDVELNYSTNERGANEFRTKLPLRKVAGTPWGVAADGQMGVIMKVYREWQLSGDSEFLKSMWENTKKALSYAWVPGGWDADRDGIMEGIQHNTYDIEFYGPNPMMTVWYLGALRCGELMAAAVGDGEFAAECRRLFESGSKWVDENLFNGEFYIQHIRPVDDLSKIPREQVLGMGGKDPRNPDFQMGQGCLSDQLLGQYFAHIVGIGDLLDKENMRKTAQSIFKYNFVRNLHNHANNMRTYALNDEGGLLLCSWPSGGREKFPFPYYCEVWTGIEYSTASLLIYEGMAEEGIRIVETARARHDGRRRNPWCEPECGHHYARAMASWATVLALTGFHFNGIDKSIRFNPKINRNHFRTVWLCGRGWGNFTQSATGSGVNAQLELRAGELALHSCEIGVGARQLTGAVTAILRGQTIPAVLEIKDGIARIKFGEEIRLSRHDAIHISIS